MAATSSVAGVGPGVPTAQLEAQYQVAVLKQQKKAMDALGVAALRLIQAAFIPDLFVGQKMDVLA